MCRAYISKLKLECSKLNKKVFLTQNIELFKGIVQRILRGVNNKLK
jgi:hypothetical protein